VYYWGPSGRGGLFFTTAEFCASEAGAPPLSSEITIN